MTIKIESPYSFSERILLYGEGGSGKSEAVLSVARHVAHGDFHILDTDISAAYQRSTQTTHTDIADRVNITEAGMDWVEVTDAIATLLDPAGKSSHDWCVIDAIDATWEACQGWFVEAAYGMDIEWFLMKLQQEHKDNPKGYSKALNDAMNWPLINKEYARKIYTPIQKWKGNLILCAASKAVGDRDGDDIKDIFGSLGSKPAGNKRLTYAAATNLQMTHPKPKEWQINTAKDRNREGLYREPVENFALDYLVGVAGWRRVKTEKVAGNVAEVES